MLAKTSIQEKARKLRFTGESLGAIAQRLNVSKSSVSLWCRSIALDGKTKKKLSKRTEASRLGALANHIKRRDEIELIKKRAAEEFDPLVEEDLSRLRDIGTALYWAEGTKKHLVDITNSDPNLIRLGMLWLRKVCHVPEQKFRAAIFYHSGQNETALKKYWSAITGIPLDQFHKSIFKEEGTGHRKKILDYGTCKIRVCDTNLLHRILGWIDQLHLKM